MKNANAWLKGFRTILLTVLSYALLLVDTLASHISGLSADALKGALIIAVPIVVKQIITDVRPRLKGVLNK